MGLQLDELQQQELEQQRHPTAVQLLHHHMAAAHMRAKLRTRRLSPLDLAKTPLAGPSPSRKRAHYPPQQQLDVPLQVTTTAADLRRIQREAKLRQQAANQQHADPEQQVMSEEEADPEQQPFPVRQAAPVSKRQMLRVRHRPLKQVPGGLSPPASPAAAPTAAAQRSVAASIRCDPNYKREGQWKTPEEWEAAEQAPGEASGTAADEPGADNVSDEEEWT